MTASYAVSHDSAPGDTQKEPTANVYLQYFFKKALTLQKSKPWFISVWTKRPPLLGGPKFGSLVQIMVQGSFHICMLRSKGNVRNSRPNKVSVEAPLDPLAAWGKQLQFMICKTKQVEQLNTIQQIWVNQPHRSVPCSQLLLWAGWNHTLVLPQYFCSHSSMSGGRLTCITCFIIWRWLVQIPFHFSLPELSLHCHKPTPGCSERTSVLAASY